MSDYKEGIVGVENPNPNIKTEKTTAVRWESSVP